MQTFIKRSSRKLGFIDHSIITKLLIWRLKIFFGFFYILLVAVTTIILVMSVRRSKKNLASAFLISAIVTFLTILVLALGILRSFDAFFLKFHQVAFTNDFW